MNNYDMDVTKLHPIVIGYQGEKDVVTISFDYTPWIETYGEGTLSALVKRPHDQNPYPVVLDLHDAVAVWTVSDIDTQYEGNGNVQLIFTVGESIKKSSVMNFFVSRSLAPQGDDPPDPYESWIDELVALAKETEKHVESASASAESASFYATRAEEAAESVEETMISKANVIINASSGGIVSFDDGTDNALVKKAMFSINHVQNLRGQDAPYPDGCGKNLLPPSDNMPITSNGITAVVNADESYTFGGTATATATINLRDFSLSAGDYFLSAAGSTITAQSPGSGTCRLYIRDIDNASTLAQFSLSSMPGDISFSVSVTTNVRAYVLINNGWTVSGKLYPMIRKSTESDATFAPYSNICPIDGYTKVDALRTGINVWDEDWEVGDISGISGNNSSNTNMIRSKNYIPVVPGREYFFQVGSQTENLPVRPRFYDINKRFLGVAAQDGTSVYYNRTFVVPNDAYFFRFSMREAYGTVYLNDISINYTSNDTEYHAYSGQSIAYLLGQTVYSGTLTINDNGSGQVVSTMASVDLGTLSWSSDENILDGMFRANVKTLNTKYAKVYSSILKGVAPKAYSNFNYGEIGLSNSSASPILRARSEAFVGKTGAELSDYLAGQQLVYTLTTPVVINLTEQEVLTTILGHNNIWHGANGNTALEYRADTHLYIDNKYAEINAIKAQIAPIEYGATASQAYASGAYFWHDGQFCKSLTPIASGAAFTLGTNYATTTFANELYIALNS